MQFHRSVSATMTEGDVVFAWHRKCMEVMAYESEILPSVKYFFNSVYTVTSLPKAENSDDGGKDWVDVTLEPHDIF